MIERIEKELFPLREQLKHHPVYHTVKNTTDIQLFMEQHVFAVWDFMSLLKQLQNLLSCNEIPWRPSGYPKASRLINEIVWGEESDVNRKGEAMSHFEMYLEAMLSLGANPHKIEELLKNLQNGSSIDELLNTAQYPPHITNFLKFTFEVVASKKTHILAAVFTFGREDLIPDMFVEIIKNIKDTEDENLLDLIYYFERHIEVDSGEHGPMALEMVKQLCGNDANKWEEALDYSKQALRLRIQLWDGILASVENKNVFISIEESI